MKNSLRKQRVLLLFGFGCGLAIAHTADQSCTHVSHHSFTAGRKKAEAALAQLILDHEHQPIAPKAELGTVADLLDRWLASQAHRLSPKTLAEYRRAARLKILPHIGAHRSATSVFLTSIACT